MKVWIERPIRSLDYEIAVAQHAGREVNVASGIGDDGHIIWKRQSEAEVIPVLFRASEDLLKQLLITAGEHIAPDAATVVHLKDTIAVRDRLLAMVEKRGTRG